MTILTHASASNRTGLKYGAEPFVFGDADAAVLHDPLAIHEQAGDAPADEHPEARVLEPFPRREPFRRHDIARLGPKRGGKECKDQDRGHEFASEP